MSCQHDGADEGEGGIIRNAWKKTGYEWFVDK
jgi:hypothetical protein